jgi:hypothetical protein
MNGASFIEHKGKRIVLLDFAGIQDPAAGLPLIAAAGRFVQALPADGSALSCTDVRNTKYDREVVDAFKVMSKGNGPHVKAAAVITDSAIHRAAISMIALFSRRKIVTFDTKEKALDWLVAQA